MRKQYEEVLKSHFYRKLSKRRGELGITQEERASRLAMGSRSYVELDHGRSGCSGLTLARFLIYVCEDPLSFLEELRHAFDRRDQDAA